MIFKCTWMSFVRGPLMAVFLWGSLNVGAQQKTAPQITSVEDPELYYAFLRAHAEADVKIQASAPAAAAALSNSTAALYHISAADVPKISAEVRKFNINMGALYLAQQNYLYQQKLAQKPPDMKVLIRNQWQRQRLVMNAHGGIHKVLPKASWDGLHTYINGDFKANLAAGKGAGK